MFTNYLYDLILGHKQKIVQIHSNADEIVLI